MKKFKKLCCILLAVALLCVGLVGCGGQDDQKITNLSIGGGGVLAGVATAVKSINPKCRVIGAEPERIPRYSESRKQGKPVTVELKDTLADGLMITTTGTNTYPLIEEYVDEIVPVPEYAIAKALNYIVYKAKVVVEPSAAIGVAALISGGFKVKPGEKVCFVLTGGNIDPKKLIDLTEC